MAPKGRPRISTVKLPPKRKAPKKKPAEEAVWKALEKAGIDFEFQKYVKFDNFCRTRCAYVDFLITTTWGSICLEIDENEHFAKDDYQRDKDVFRFMNRQDDDAVVFLRFNPDTYYDGETEIAGDLPQRLDRLCSVIQTMERPESGIQRQYMFFSRDEGALLPRVVKNWEAAAQDMCVMVA